MNRGALTILLLTAVTLGLIGCAGPQPFTMSCAISNFQKAEPGQRIQSEGFSVAAPTSGEWCMGPPVPNSASFVTHPLMGQYIEKPERYIALNTIGLIALRVNVKTKSLTNPIDFQEFIQDWVDRGLPVDFDQGLVRPGNIADDPRYTVLNLESRVDNTTDNNCVRYKTILLDRDHPNAPNMVMEKLDYGLICQHPTNMALRRSEWNRLNS